MYESAREMQTMFYGPLVRVWEERIRSAQSAKSRFNRVAKICSDFYESQSGFMWRDKQYFSGEVPEPRFSICIAKAFEFVAIYGPHLFWQYANRKVFSQRRLKLRPELFGDIQDETVRSVAEAFIQRDREEQARQDFANEMMTIYLNWSQREQPGTLIHHGMMATIESLIKGMGVLWPETYIMPGSEDVFTRLNYDTVDNLYVDPDCTDPLWETAGYVMRRHVTPIWEVERIFGLPRGALDGKGSAMSAEMRSRKRAGHEAKNPSNPATFDAIEWYEIWSRVGVGPRTQQLSHQMLDVFDDYLGDFAYLCIAPGVEYPLNAPAEKFFGESPATPETVSEMFQWRCANFGAPFPVWRDNRWPVSRVFYNPVPGSAWPLAPLAPGLGELIAINVLTTSYVDTAWENRRQILAYVKSAASEIEEILNSDTPLVKIGLNDNIHKSIHETIQFLNKPPANTDQLRALEMLSENFNRRVGLNELQYGESRTQIRVAADSRAKTEALSIRPQKMAGDVGRWLTDASQKEMFLAALHVRGQSLVHLLGEFGAQSWDSHFGNMDPDRLMREFKATVEASEVARPNKERDTANIQALQQYLLPLLQAYAQQTSDTAPLNSFLEVMADAMDMQSSPVNLPPWRPPVDEEARQQEKQIQEQSAMVEIQRKAADAEAKLASAKKMQVEAAAKAVEASVPGGMIGEMKHEQELRHKEESHRQEMVHNAEGQIQRLLFDTERKPGSEGEE